ncbi:helix-turn-helix domain-containing protein [Streptomyces sp. NPDC004012]
MAQDTLSYGDEADDDSTIADLGGRRMPETDFVREKIGERLRAHRLRLGKSVRALAGEVGISPSAMSQFETGRSLPSVITLYAIVNKLGVSLDEIFDETNGSVESEARRRVTGETPVCHENERRIIRLDSGVEWQRLTPAADPDLDFLYVVYAVGGSSSANNSFVRHSGREYGLVQRGRLKVTLGFETFELGPGDSITFDSTTPHRLETVGDEPVHAVWVVRERGSAS